MSATSDAWPIYDPSITATPIDAILSHIASHGLYTVADTTERATLLSDLASAGVDDTYIAVRRLDATAGQEIEYTIDGGSTWQVIRAEETDAAWTPTYSGVTIGNGTVTAVYHERDGWITAVWKFTLGSTSAISGTISPTLPANALAGQIAIGYAYAFDTSGGTSFVGIARANSSATQLVIEDTNGGALWDNNTPVAAWATGDIVTVTLHYPKA